MDASSADIMRPFVSPIVEILAPSPELKERLIAVRKFTHALVGKLSDADTSVQAMADASPTKWHLAHTTWFFETYVLKPFVKGYNVYDQRYHFLFNSDYDSEGPRLARAARGLLTRPSLHEIIVYCSYVTKSLLQAWTGLPQEAFALIELGCHHEERHQELLLTDLLYLFSRNPLMPAAWPTDTPHTPVDGSLLDRANAWVPGKTGLVEIGNPGGGFTFDAERPRHKVWLAPHALASHLVTNSQWLEFVNDDGYRKSSLWLVDGWAWVNEQAIEGPLHWRRKGNAWISQFGLGGIDEIDMEAPVCHISYFEAAAFARWSGARLPTEAEWEAMAQDHDPAKGNLLDVAGAVFPRRAGGAEGVEQLFGDVWEWTSSAFLPYPGFQPTQGAAGAFNGKFISGQFVLRGGSCATPRRHTRASYRNFLYPHQRWQFTGVRLAKDLK